MSTINQIRLKNITEVLKPTDIFAVYRNKTWIPVKGLRFDDLIFGDPTILDTSFQINGYVQAESFKGNIFDVSTTSTVNVSGYTHIHITSGGITLSLTGETDGQMITIKNLSSGDIILNFNIFFQGALVTAPITMPAGDSYPLVYDADNTRWVL